MKREFSAGGVVLRRLRNGLNVAVINPAGRGPAVLQLPKGHVEAGEPMATAAVREVLEETGLIAIPWGEHREIRYTYTWQGERVFKVVRYFGMTVRAGRIDDLVAAMRVEVALASWLPVSEIRRMTYADERGVIADLVATAP